MEHRQKLLYKIMRQTKYTLLIFGEGSSEEKFYKKLTTSKNFLYHLGKKWAFPIFDSASGGSPQVIVEKCENKNRIDGGYDLVICFIDIDKLKEDFKKDWKEKKKELEKRVKENNIVIIWQDKDLEDEIIKINPKLKGKSKQKIQKWGVSNINKFISSELDEKIKKIIKEKRLELYRKNI